MRKEGREKGNKDQTWAEKRLRRSSGFGDDGEGNELRTGTGQPERERLAGYFVQLLQVRNARFGLDRQTRGEP